MEWVVKYKTCGQYFNTEAYYSKKKAEQIAQRMKAKGIWATVERKEKQ